MIITLDFETYYDTDYSLSRMSEVEYLLDPRYQTIMCAIKLGDAPTVAYLGEANIREAFAQIDFDNHAVLAHNTRFDGSILAWHYGIVPRLLLDTMAMARSMIHPYSGSSSLANVAKYLALPAKGDTVVRARGKRLESFTRDELQEYQEYCIHDTDLCRQIFDRFMASGFPKSELRVIDIALRCFLAPQAWLDPHKLAAHLHHVQALKAQALAKVAHVDKSVFSSNLKFAALLEMRGVEVPRKISPTTGEEIYALAKNDRAFRELCADADQSIEVQALLACRLGQRSTIEETRTQTMLGLALREWPGQGTGWMPVAYRYYAAITGRFGGDGGTNFANLPRGSAIRDAITAPDGYRVVHRDSSQIEARMLAWLAGCHTLLDAFREGRDVYSEFASRFYKRRVTKADKVERQAGKTAILQLGYSSGAEKFRHTLFVQQGIDMPIEDAQTLVRLYRELYHEIPMLWRHGDAALLRMMIAAGRLQVNTLTPLVEPIPVVREDVDAIWLPNGQAIQYPDLRVERNLATREENVVYDGPYGEMFKLYGGKLVANVTSALARIIVTDIMVRVHARTGYHPVMSTYDSLDYVVEEEQAIDIDELLTEEFAVVPVWAPDLPLASEGGWGVTLAEAERGVNR